MASGGGSTVIFRADYVYDTSDHNLNNFAVLSQKKILYSFTFHGATTSSEPGPPRYRGCTIILKHNTSIGIFFYE